MQLAVCILDIIALIYAFISCAFDIRINRRLDNVLSGLTIGLPLLFFIFELTGVSDFAALHGLFLPSAMIACVGLFYKLAKSRIKSQDDDKAKFIRAAIILVFVVGFAELFLFNFKAYHLVVGDYNKSVLKVSDAVISGTAEDYSVYKIIKNRNTAVFEFSNVNTKIGNMKFNVSSSDGYSDIRVYWADETNAEYRGVGVSTSVIDGMRSTENFACDFSGNVLKLKVSVTAPANTTIYFGDITLNEPAGVDFSFARFITIFVFLLVVYSVFGLSIFKKKSGTDGFSLLKRICVFVVIVCITIGTILTSNASNGIVEDFDNPPLNQINQELVDAFEAGSVSLLETPPQKLLDLENPYDWSQRTGFSYKWDHLLFNGKYYSYYGIAPVLLIFLPYHALTGKYFPSVWAIWLFGVIGIIAIAMILYNIIKKFFRDIPLGMALVGLISLECVCGVWFCFPIANFYEIAQSAGFCFTALGSYFLLASNPVGTEKINNIKACLSSVFLSLAVLSRPTLAVYCIVALLFIYYGIRKLRTEANYKKKVTSYLLSSMIPFVVIGGIQMLYNYVRFGSPFDFGIQYSLTINDFTRSEYFTHMAAIGFYNFLFAPPSFTTSFPFVQSSFSTLSVPGYYYVANQNAVGMFFRATQMFSYFFAVKAYKSIKPDKRNKALVLILSACIIAPAVIIFSIWESGYGVRYCADFAWQMLLGALLIFFVLYKSKETDEAKNMMYGLFGVAAVLCVIVCFAQSFSYTYGSNMNINQFARLFEFWR